MEKFRVHYQDHSSVDKIAECLKSLQIDKPIKFLCVGTDRSTGDSLGPYLGTLLEDLGYDVIGTLNNPLHAVNLQETIEEYNNFVDYFTIAIDACLGRSESVGFISIKEGSLQPGTGVNKNLPSVGNMQIIGIVNVGGFMEYMVLQNTRLSFIINMAEVIAKGIKKAFPNETWGLIDDKADYLQECNL